MTDEAFSPLSWHRAVLSDRCTLDPSESLVMLALVVHAGESGHAWPSVGKLCKETRVGHTKVVQSVSELEARGLLSRLRPKAPSDDVPLKYFEIAEERRPNLYKLASVPAADGLEGKRRLAPVREANRSKDEESSGSPGGPVRVAEGSGPLREPHPVRQAEGRGSPGEHKLPSELLILTAQGTAEVTNKASKRSPKPKQERAAKWRRVPSSWQPNDAHRAIAAQRGLALAEQLETFRDHEFAQLRSDADAAFRNWLRRAFPSGGKQRPSAKQPEDKSPQAWKAKIERREAEL